MEVEVLVAQSCLTLCNPIDSSPPGFSVHVISQARILVSHSRLQEIFLTQGSNPGLLHCRQILYHLSHQRSHSGPTPHLISAPRMIQGALNLP